MDRDDIYNLPPARPMVIVISGPSGVGKDVTLAGLRELQSQGFPFRFVVTATTRPPREGETHGVDYFFYSKDEFEGMIERGELVEYALVYGQYKGIPRAQIDLALESGQDIFLRLDVQGAASVRAMFPDALTIYLIPESEAVLISRLVGRQTDTPEQLEKRIATAKGEMARLGEFDYVVVNRQGRLEETVREVVGIIQAEKRRVGRILTMR